MHKVGNKEDALRVVEELTELLKENTPKWDAILAEGITDEDKDILWKLLNGLGASQILYHLPPEELINGTSSIFAYAFCVGYQRGRGNRPVMKWKVAEEEENEA